MGIQRIQNPSNYIYILQYIQTLVKVFKCVLIKNDKITFVCNSKMGIRYIRLLQTNEYNEKSGTHIICRKEWHILQMFVVIFGTN